MLGAKPPALPFGWFCSCTEARDVYEGFPFLRESTLVGQHCKGRQQIIIKTTENKVRGHRQMALLALSFKMGLSSQGLGSSDTSKRDVQTNPFLTSQEERTVGPRLTAA